MKTPEQIAKENDLFRKTMILTKRHRVVLSENVSSHEKREEIIEAVRNFEGFSADNDPYGEHDFGKVIVDETSYFFKIDYYDENLEYGVDPKEEPAIRVMTIMSADEY